MAKTSSLNLVRASTQRAYVADHSALDITGDMTIECWVKIAAAVPSSGVYTLVRKDNGGAAGTKSYGINYYWASAGVYKFGCIMFGNGNATYAQVDFTYTLTPGVWYHIAWVVTIANAQATENELFINGVSQGNGSIEGAASLTSQDNSNAQLQIGGTQYSADNTLLLDGKICEVRLWDDVRTSTELKDNMNKELVGNEANLKAYWKLNGGLEDSTSNGNHLSLTNSPVFHGDAPFFGAKINLNQRGRVLSF